MNLFHAVALLLFAALFPSAGRALEVPPVVNYSFIPSNPTADDVVRFRMDVEGCFHHPVWVGSVGGEATIEVRIFGLDYTCDPEDPENVATPRFYDVGRLPAGVYATRVLFCVPVPPPEEHACDAVQEGALVVRGVLRPPRVVPIFSAWALGLFAGVVFFFGLVGFRRG